MRRQHTPILQLWIPSLISEMASLHYHHGPITSGGPGISLTNPDKAGRVDLLLRLGCGDTPIWLVGGISPVGG